MPGRVARCALLASGSLLALLALLASPARTAAQSPFVNGPTLMDARRGSVVVLVETGALVPVSVETRIGDEAGVRRFDSPEASRHAIRLTDLPDDSTVRYRVFAPGFAEESGTYRAPPARHDGEVELLVYGDSRDGASVHADLIRQMRATRGAFVVHLGDMVPRGARDEEWDEFLRIANPLLRDRPLVPVLGNHELIAGDEARARYFAHIRVDAPDGVAFHSFEYGPVRILALDSNASMAADSAQYRFVVRELVRARGRADPREIVVAIHHGPYSSGRHGDFAPVHESGLVRLMRDAGVHLVLSGHDHLYERGDVGRLKYIVSGGGGSPLYPTNRRRPGQLAFSPEHHFLRIRASHGRFDVDAIRPNGATLEHCVFDGPRAWDCGGRGPRGAIGGEAPGALEGHALARALFGLLLVSVLAVAAYLLYRRSRRPL